MTVMFILQALSKEVSALSNYWLVR